MVDDVLLLDVFKELERRIADVELRDTGPAGDSGDKGDKGDSGEKGDSGNKGEPGKKGLDGIPPTARELALMIEPLIPLPVKGDDGEAGKDAPYIVSVVVDFDQHLVITMSDGEEHDAGQIIEWDENGKTIIHTNNGGGGGGIFTGAGSTGKVPDPVTENGYFLRDDGTWVAVSGGGSAGFGMNPSRWKAANDPIVVLCFGQSNMLPAWANQAGAPDLVQNTSVITWGTSVGSSAPNSGGTFTWHSVDPDDALYGDFVEGDVYTGIPANQYGCPGIGFAYAIQEGTQKEVRLINIAKTAQPISAFEPLVGAVALEMKIQIDAAMAALAIEYPSSTLIIDHVLFGQGTSDAQVNTSYATYTAAYLELMDWIDTEWGDEFRTTRTITQRTNRYVIYPNWDGQEYAALADPGRSRIISSVGRKIGDAFVHFYGDVAIDLGRASARAVLFGPDPLIDAPKPWGALEGFRDIAGGPYIYEGTAAGAPAAPTLFVAAKWKRATDDSEIRVRKSYSLFFADLALQHIVDTDTVRFTDSTDADKWIEFTVNADPVDNTTYWTFPTNTSPTTGSSGAPAVNDSTLISTSAVEPLDRDIISTQTGSRLKIGPNPETMPDARAYIRSPYDEGVMLGMSSLSESAQLNLTLTDALELAIFDATGTLIFNSTTGVTFAVIPTGGASAVTGMSIVKGGSDYNLMYTGGIALSAGLPPSGVQNLIGPPVSASNQNAGMALQGGSTLVNRYGFQDETTSTSWAAYLEFDHPNDRLTLQNNMGGTNLETLWELETNSVGYWASDVTTATGLSIKDISGARIELCASLRNAPTTATQELWLKGTKIQLEDGAGGTELASLVGTGERDVRVGADGVLIEGLTSATQSLDTVQTTGSGWTVIGALVSPADNSKKKYVATITASKSTGDALYIATIEHIGWRSTGNWTSAWVKTNEQSIGVGSTLDVQEFDFFGAFFWRVNGNASETWNWSMVVNSEDI